jgi:ketosteroid isomerase-like protein
MTDIDKDIARVLAAYQAAVHAKDAEAFARLYDAKVRVFDAWGVWSYDELPAWRSAVEAWFVSLGTEKVKVSFDEVQVTGTASLAVVSATVTYAAVSAQGEMLRSLQNRLTWVLRTSSHVLRIVHEHSSAPVGFDDMKAILQRPQR